MGTLKNSKTISHNQKIFNHMLQHGTINPAQAESLYHCRRLASRIHDLKMMGFDIEKRMIRYKDSDGQPTSYAEYTLVG